MQILIAAMLGLLVALPVAAADLPKPSGADIVSSEAMLELLFTRTADIEGGLTEGPAVAPDGSIYFSDIPFGKDNGMILRVDPESKKTTVFSNDSGKSNGLIFDSKGNLLACEGANFGGRCVSRWDVKTRKKAVIVDGIKGKHFNAPNDLCLDSNGRVYFTDTRYLGDEPRELEHRAVYRVNKKGRIVEITHDLTKPNGIALSPDGKTLYVANHDNGTDKIDPTKPPPPQGVMTIYAFPLNSRGRVDGRRKTLVDFGAKKGCDGMCVDERGNVYLTVRDAGRPGVMVVNPNGKEVAFIPTGREDQSAADPENPPVGLPSNVEFGIADESNMLYVTVDKSMYRIKLKADGFHVQYQ